jgi:hypothetical protein
MITFSDDPQRAEEQMRAIILYLSGLGYVDGEFDGSEKAFVRGYIRKLIEHRVASAKIADEVLRKEMTERYTTHFLEVFEEIDRSIQALFAQTVASGEKVETYVYSNIKLRCYEVFQELDDASRKALLETVNELIMADGVVHPNEARFRDELQALLATEIPLDEAEMEEIRPVEVKVEPAALPLPRLQNHPFLERLEQHYSRDPVRLREQAAADYGMIERVIAKLDEQRAAGAGRLAGKQSVAELAGGGPFLDGGVYVLPPAGDVELIVLGDLHGCYSCLKGALLQSDFFAKVQAYKSDPANHPDVKLVLLGDYIDRGMYSYSGVLRTVLQTFLTAPEHVYVLRGNHEYYFEHEGKIYGGVRPAEAILTHEPYMPKEMFGVMMRLFEALPHMLLSDRFCFVHGGIPRDELIDERWKDLASLNDVDMRFQMLWSDPSQADFVPRDLQAESARFAFGRLQLRSFMARLGANIMVRGHTKVVEGFKKIIDDGIVVLLNLFSAGGERNDDLPSDSSYREVKPMALTIRRSAAGEATITPWEIDYARFNNPERNAFFRAPPEIEFKTS